MRWRWLFLSAGIVFLVGIYLRLEPLRWAHYTDPVVYLCGAQAIAEGHGYRYVAYVGEPKIGCHPPLQSAYLALFWKLHPSFPANLSLLYGAMILCAAATFILFFRMAVANGMPAGVSLGCLLLWGLSPAWGTLIYSFVSDILFGCLWLALAWCWDPNLRLSDRRRWLVSGGLLALLYLCRSAAAALIVGVLILIVWRARSGRSWKLPALALTPVVVAGLAWKAWAAGTPGYGEYIALRISQEGGWQPLLSVLLTNAIECLSGQGFLHCLMPGLMDLPSSNALTETWFSPLLTALLMIAGWIFTACWVYGCFWRGSRLERAGGLLVVLYLLQLVVYPANLSERCLFAPLPFVLLWAWKGRSLVARWFPKPRVLASITAAFLVLNVAGNSVAFWRASIFLQRCGYAEEVAEVGAWMRAHTAPDAVVAATLTEPIMHLYNSSGRQVVENYFQPQPWFSPTEHSMSMGRKADYMLLSWYSFMSLEELNFQRFELVATSSQSRYRLYRVGTGH